MIKVLVFYDKPSRYGPAREGKFVMTKEYPNKLIYKGQPIDVDEFNDLPDEMFHTDSHAGRLKIKILEFPDPERTQTTKVKRRTSAVKKPKKDTQSTNQ